MYGKELIELAATHLRNKNGSEETNTTARQRSTPRKEKKNQYRGLAPD